MGYACSCVLASELCYCFCLPCFTLPCKGLPLVASCCMEAYASSVTARWSQVSEVPHLLACIRALNHAEQVKSTLAEEEMSSQILTAS